MNTCPRCHQPCKPNELAAYGKCEDCYNGKVIAAPTTALTQHKQPCGGGTRVVRSGKEMS